MVCVCTLNEEKKKKETEDVTPGNERMTKRMRKRERDGGRETLTIK